MSNYKAKSSKNVGLSPEVPYKEKIKRKTF